MLKNYIKTAFKVFLRRKFFTFVSLFGICFTLTVLMVATTLFDHAVGPYPPEVNADRTLKVSMVLLAKKNEGPGWQMSSSSLGYGFVDRYVRKLETPEKMAVLSRLSPSIAYQGDDKVEMQFMRVNNAYWEVLQFEFIEGRPFSAEEDVAGAQVAVINEATRQKLFGGKEAVGRTLETAQQSYRVVGVVKNAPEFCTNAFAEVWVPVRSSPVESHGRAGFFGPFQVLLLAHTPVDMPRIQAEYAAMLAEVDLSEVPPYDRICSSAETAFETYAGLSECNYFGGYFEAGKTNLEVEKRNLILKVAGGVLLFLLLPVLNLVNLNTSRILERASEIGVRKAFGAPSRTLVGQFLVENLLLTLIGGILSLMTAGLLLEVFETWGWSEYAEFHLNYRIFLAGFGLAVFFGLLSGVYPAWRMSRLHPTEALRRAKG
jgi:putative ABC transport system permease protein